MLNCWLRDVNRDRVPSPDLAHPFMAFECRKGLCNGFVKRFCRNFKGVLVAVRVFARYRAGPQTQGDHLSRRTRISAISDPFTR